MTQKPARRQHYVSHFYLRKFTDANERLWVYDTESRKIFSCLPRNVAFEADFYGSTQVESWFSRTIDGPASVSFDLLLRGQTLPTKDIRAFWRFVAAQMHRTPESLKRMKQSCAPVFQEMVERMAKYDSKCRTNMIRKIQDSGVSPEELQDFISMLDNGYFKVKPTRQYLLVSNLRLIKLVADELAQMRWCFWRVPPSEDPLVLCDNPVTLEDTLPSSILGACFGLRNPTIEIAVPISPRLLAIGAWDGSSSYGELASGESQRINRRILAQAKRYVFASYRSDALMSLALELRGTGPQIQTQRIVLGEQLVISSRLGRSPRTL